MPSARESSQPRDWTQVFHIAGRFFTIWATREAQTLGIKKVLPITLGFPGGTSGKESTYQHRRHKRPRFDPWLGKIPWRKAWQPIPVFLPGESHGQRSLVGYSPQGHKESDTTTETMHTHIWIGCSLRSSCVFVYLPFTSTWYLKTKESLNETVTMLVWK